ncbi:peptide ligase PGM1-related protein [Streptomyces viridosporus]|uniref:peptide ligase PGM1-related protein n=1 Tax=Streptomyces viridosporus TaxID=67581 RepID=UPI003325BD9F
MSEPRQARTGAVLFGSFDAERRWRPEGLASLPQLADPGADRLVACMDEALFAAAEPGDLLITRDPVAPALVAAREAAGYTCEHHHTGGTHPGPDADADVEHRLLANAGLLRRIGGFARLHPYAVLPATGALADLTGHATDVPGGEQVVRVNGKAWSSLLAARHGLPGAGRVVRSAAELAEAVRSYVEPGHSVVLVKDSYGVAGRGTFEVTSERRLARLVAHLRRQEDRGLAVEFVVQPLYDRVADFSSHLLINPDGSWRLLGVQHLANSGYRHEMSGPVPHALVGDLRRPAHPEVMELVARSLAGEGYLGPVCVDSMVLRDGTWIPILEVNARMSMGGLNLRLDNRVREHGLRSHLWQEDVTIHDSFDVDHLLKLLREEGLLYEGGSGAGVLLLVGGALVAPRGRLVCAALCPPDAFPRLRAATRTVAASAGIPLARAA